MILYRWAPQKVACSSKATTVHTTVTGVHVQGHAHGARDCMVTCIFISMGMTMAWWLSGVMVPSSSRFLYTLWTVSIHSETGLPLSKVVGPAPRVVSLAWTGRSSRRGLRSCRQPRHSGAEDMGSMSLAPPTRRCRTAASCPPSRPQP